MGEEHLYELNCCRARSITSHRGALLISSVALNLPPSDFHWLTCGFPNISFILLLSLGIRIHRKIEPTILMFILTLLTWQPV